MANTKLFDDLAVNYDTEPRKEVALHTAATVRDTLASLGIEGKTLIDYGCGTGLVGLQLVDLFDEVTFIDAAPNMVEVLQEKIQNENIPNARVICANATKGLDDSIKADVMILAQVLLHEADTRALLDALNSAINPGGIIIIVDFERNDSVESDRVHAGFELMQLQADLLYGGFEPLHFQLFLHAEKYFMGQDASLFILVAKKP